MEVQCAEMNIIRLKKFLLKAIFCALLNARQKFPTFFPIFVGK